uniref:Protein artemis n=1 Tax=Ciona savignyi TaxID=51511 RepID=H2YVM0_CIOSA
MNGHNINSAISVDCFKEPANSRLHFLTHMHSDHTVGLSSTWSHVIYCSEVTSKLLSLKFSISSKYIQVLDWDHLYCLKSQGDTICVKMLPANHCPGACMFLFESKTDRILYTGDFRFNEEIEKALHKVISPHNPIDVLYLDNTYCEPSCDFPTQDEAVQMIIKICQHHPKHRIIIGMSFIGHEELLCKVAQAIHEYVYVEESIFERVKLIDGVYGEIFKAGRSTRLNAVPNHLIKASAISKWNEEVKTIVIKPTARLGNVTSIGGDLCTSGLTYTVPYSNHSNFKELTEFVRQVNPRAIIPIVPGRKPFSG